jgi:hypothetical protein
MKKLITSLAFAMLASMGFSQNTPWVNSLANSGINAGADVEFDENGQVTVVGEFSGTVNFNPKGTANNIVSAGGKDIFIAKYDNTSGALIWVKTIGGTADDVATAIDIDAGNNLVVVGTFSSANVDFDPGTGSTLLSSSGSTDLFVLKLTTAGAFVWAQRAGGTQSELMNDVLIGSSNEIYLAGSFQTLMDFFSNTNTTTNGARDAFICKLDAAGTFQWVKVIGGAGTDVSNKLSSYGTAVVLCSNIGSGSTTFNYGDGATDGTFSGTTGTNGIFTLFTNAGALDSYGQFAGNTQAIKAVVTGGYTAIIGTLSGTADIDPKATTQSATSVGATDMFIVTLSSLTSGTFTDYQLVSGLSSTHQIVPMNVSHRAITSASMDVYITGYAKGSGNFDGVAGAEITGPVTNDFSFVAKYNVAYAPTTPDINYRYAYGNANSTNAGNASRGHGVAVSSGGGGVAATGFYYSTASAATTFNPGGTITQTSPSSNNAGFIQFINNCTNPTLTGTAAARCGTGTVALTATPSAGTVSWYAAASGGSALGTGTSFTTPSITGTTTYYAEASNSGCTSSPRTAVVATVNPLPTITGGAAPSRCGAGTLTLTATPSAGTVSWYAAASGGSAIGAGASFTTPSISVNTTYYAQATNNGCVSSARASVIGIVNAIPTVTGFGASRCGTASMEIAANPTPIASTISWFAAASGGSALGTGTSFTTPIISTTTTYYAEATNNGCVSASRTAVVATISSLPTVTATGAFRCGTGTIALTATPSTGILSWFAAASGGSALSTGTSFTTPSISTTTTYYAEANNGCPSSPRTAVLATVNTIPTITGTGAARCGTGTVALTATASVGTVSWFTAASGGSALWSTASYTTPSISNTTTYYAEATNAGCPSTTRAAVVATVNTIPSAVATLSGNILTATESGATYQWINCTSNANVVGATSQTFLPASSGSYKVLVTKNTCPATSTCTNITITALAEQMEANGLSIYPNPFNNLLEIELGENKNVSAIKIYNNLGVLVFETKTDNSNLVINTNDWETDSYIVEFSNNETSLVKKLVLKN